MREKTIVLKYCLICGKPFYKNLCRLKIGKGKYCSKKCYGISRRGKPAWNKGMKGKPSKFKGLKRPDLSREKHWNWQGGISLKDERTNEAEWKNLRKQIYQRDNWTCQKCGKHCYKDIQCHHIVPFRRVNGDKQKIVFWNVRINDFGNLITLCSSCHAREDRNIRKKEEVGDYGFSAIFRSVSSI